MRCKRVEEKPQQTPKYKDNFHNWRLKQESDYQQQGSRVDQ